MPNELRKSRGSDVSTGEQLQIRRNVALLALYLIGHYQVPIHGLGSADVCSMSQSLPKPQSKCQLGLWSHLKAQEEGSSS